MEPKPPPALAHTVPALFDSAALNPIQVLLGPHKQRPLCDGIRGERALVEVITRQLLKAPSGLEDHTQPLLTQAIDLTTSPDR